MTPINHQLFLGHFDSIRDPRVTGRCKYLLHELIGIIVCGLVCGLDDLVSIAEFGASQQQWFRDRLGFQLAHGTPTHDTLNRILSAIDPKEFEKCFHQFLAYLLGQYGPADGIHIAIDGKTLRGTKRQIGGKQKMTHIVSAWASEAGVCLGQVRTDEKSNEITAIPEILRFLDLKGAIVTIDAMGCQTAIAEQIVTGGGDYLLAVKGNQQHLHEDVAKLAEQAVDSNYAGLKTGQLEAKGLTHGRSESRYCFVISNPEVLQPALRNFSDWKNLKAVVGITSVREIKGETTYETRLYISSRDASAEEFLKWTREHWSIENNCHWLLDMAFAEDQQRLRTGHADENMNLIRKVIIPVLKDSEVKMGVKNKRRKAAYDPAYRETIFRTIFPGF